MPSPGEGGKLSFERDIKPLFRTKPSSNHFNSQVICTSQKSIDALLSGIIATDRTGTTHRSEIFVDGSS
jgi:hypothetical protein